MSTGKNVIIAVALLILVEALTFYAYSLFWLAEGQPKNHGRPTIERLGTSLYWRDAAGVIDSSCWRFSV